ncbi:hypothetical protein K458DRAFT_300735 [Lentithecium fluviatile CBS 122367]|uniref:Benzoylformate decarboxylase n=1 Tax=Lentithecium fluviatile CBS 122367 TaxID=1168545 RepID=A0A6G1J597_9PLEO|nr:hypothetical protein K458DRAFT_300735 [Lentithecium fluviatile CBS 122367]
MALRHLSTPPKAEDFTPLQEHQEQTPATFFGAKPVLYAKQSGLTLSAAASQVQDDAIFAQFHTTPDSESENALVGDVDIWVNSENLVLFQNMPTPTGIAIPYPAIALHATMKYKPHIEALLLNISLNDADTVNADEDISILELTVLPPAYNTDFPQSSCINEIFGAMNTCADLHPDPDEDGDGGEDDMTAPGASGWITAENMDEYVDEEGNFKGVVYGEELGPGAGTVRMREEGGEASGVNGETHEEKYQRTG